MNKRKEYSLSEMISLMVKKLWIILLCMLIGAGGVFLFSKYVMQEEYTASLAMYVAPNQGIEEGRTSINDLYYAQQVTNTYVEILKTNAFMTEVARKSGLEYSAGEISKRISMKVVENTEIFQVNVVSANPEDARVIAETIASLAPEKIMSVVDVNSVKLVDPPVLSNQPTSPNLMMNTVIGFILGAFVSIGFILIRDMLDMGIKDEKDMAGNYDLNVLGTVPNEKFPVLEAFRVVRANLAFALPMTGCKKIVVTSPLPEEGKTTSLIGLAKVLSLAGNRVLILDCNMRNASMHRSFKLEGIPGLAEILADAGKMPEAIRGTVSHNLKVICAGALPSNPTELLSGGSMKELLKTLELNFDYILMDTPPINVFADALGLAEMADGFLLIARPGRTTHPEFAKALSSLEFAKVRVVGAILNDVEGLAKGKRIKSGIYSGHFFFGL